MKTPPVWFAVSDKVVLVDAGNLPASYWDRLPKKGAVYCVRETKSYPDGHFVVKLVGIRSVTTEANRRLSQTCHCWFDASRFRLASGLGSAIAKKAGARKGEA